MVSLVGCVNTSRSRTYLTCVRFFCGKYWQILAGAIIFIVNYGSAITLIKMMGDQFETGKRNLKSTNPNLFCSV